MADKRLEHAPELLASTTLTELSDPAAKEHALYAYSLWSTALNNETQQYT